LSASVHAGEGGDQALTGALRGHGHAGIDQVPLEIRNAAGPPT
jgi:hypothetical protein